MELKFSSFALCLALLVACQSGGALVVPTPEPATSPMTTASVTSRPTIMPTPSATPSPTVSPTPNGGIPAFSHIFLIMMENKEREHIIGNATAPYFNQLAGQYASTANYYAITHPSLPNYLALIGGDTFKVTTDCTSCFRDADNLADQLKTAGRTWKSYMEDMPSPCFVGDSGSLYAQQHNPFIYFDSLRKNPDQCGQIVPLSRLTADLQANAVPDFVWITPNLCNDMHDCPVKSGDAWLQIWVPQILATQAWKDNGVLFITFDEGDTTAGCCTYARGGDISTLVISPLGRPGFVSQMNYDHYSLLKTIETAWGLPLLGHAECECTPLMADFFAAP